MKLTDRWERFEQHQEQNVGDPELTDNRFALRADGQLVCFDQDGWFTIGWNVMDFPRPGPGVERKIVLRDENGNEEDVYCEPIWLSGYFDVFHYMLNNQKED